MEETKLDPPTERAIVTRRLHLAGYCDVDSGQVMIGDPCYIHDWDEEYNLDNKDDRSLSYTGACNATVDGPGFGQLNHPKGHPGAAVAVRSGFGDGTYPVYVEMSDQGEWGHRVKRLIVEFF